MFLPQLRTLLILRTYYRDRQGIPATAAKLNISNREVGRVVLQHIQSSDHTGVSSHDIVVSI